MKIKINRIPWTINITANGFDEHLYIHNKGYATGSCSYQTSEIWILKQNSLIKTTQTLRHELTHAFLSSYLLKTKETYDEEELCEFVAIYSNEINKITEKYFLKT